MGVFVQELNFVFKSEDGKRTNTDVSSLSGGEKSFAQECIFIPLNFNEQEGLLFCL